MIQPLSSSDAVDRERRRSEGFESKAPWVRDANAARVAPVRLMTGWRRAAYLVLAAGFLTLAGLGAALPGLPTTPFLLLTSYFLVRSSPSLHRRLLQSRLFGPLLQDWELRGGVRYGVKVKAIIMVILAVGLSIWLLQRSLTVSLGVVALASLGIFVIMRVPTICPNRSCLADVEKR